MVGYLSVEMDVQNYPWIILFVVNSVISPKRYIRDKLGERDIWINGHLTLWSPGYLHMFSCEIEAFKPDDTVLLVHWKSVEVHVTSHVEVDSFGESQHSRLKKLQIIQTNISGPCSLEL